MARARVACRSSGSSLSVSIACCTIFVIDYQYTIFVLCARKYAALACLLFPEANPASIRALNFKATEKLPVEQSFRRYRMPSQIVEIDGVAYMRSRDAARAIGLTSDYVCRLAREEKVAGKRIANMCSLSSNSLNDFIAKQARRK